MDQGRPCPMAYVCVKPRVSNSVNAPNNWIHSRTLIGKPNRSVLTWTASNAVGDSVESLVSRTIVVGIVFSWSTADSPHKAGSQPRSQFYVSVNFAYYFVSRFGEIQLTSEITWNLVHLQSSIQERSQDDPWSGGNSSSLTRGGQSRSDGTLWSRVQSPLKWWVNQPEEFYSIPLSFNGQRRHQGWRQIGPRLLKDWRSADPFMVSHRSKLTTPAINDAHKQTLHGGPTLTVAEMRHLIWVTQAMKKASACIKKCVTCFRSKWAKTAAHGWFAFQSNRGSRTCLLLCGPRLRRTSNIQKWNWMCQGLRSCVCMFCFKGSSSRSSIIIDVKCDGGSHKTIHCKTRHPQSNCVRQCNQLRGCKARPQRNGESGSGRGTIIQQHWMALHSSSLTQIRWTMGSSAEVDEAPFAQSHGQYHSQLRGDDNYSLPN